MTASTNPDENSYPPEQAESHKSTGFVYDDPNAAQEAEPPYVPEREFVLMPLFRRIGELLGIGRHKEPEYIYSSTLEARHDQANLAGEITGVADQEPDFAHDEPALMPEPVDLRGHWEPLTIEPLPAPPLPKPEVVQNALEPVALEASAQESEAQPAPLEAADEGEATRFEVAHYYQAPEVHLPETSQRVIEAGTSSVEQLQPKRQKAAPRSPDELDEAIAILREAGSKISAAISQSVEWLSAKEAELMRQAELALSPAPKRRRVQVANRASRPQPAPLAAPTPMVAPSEPELRPEAPSAANSDTLQFPGLQREVAWKAATEPAREQRVVKAPPTYSARPRPALVKQRPRVPFWKRIDWAQEFTPKRVAVLGGVVMAMLIVGGITFARRPASDVLPPQAHAIQSGGVTVTTHSAATTAHEPRRPTAPPGRHAVAPAPHRAPRAAAYEESDVVTHYYKQKPSPSKQSTVAGVKHYSDVQ